MTLPLVGFVSLLLREQLDPQLHNHQAHFVIFGVVGGVAFALGYAAGRGGEPARGRRVLLLSLAFMATGGFMGLHAFGTAGVLFSESRAGFQIAIPVGLLVSAFFAAGSAFVDVRPELGRRVIRQRGAPRRGAARDGRLVRLDAGGPAAAAGPNSEAATGTVLAALAVLGTIVYAVSAVRYWRLFRHRPTLLSTAVIACFLLLAEAMIGVAITGERKWHASWWEWHGLIVLAYLIIGFAARREWRDERFRRLYLPSTRERRQEISVLFGDLEGYTSFSERRLRRGRGGARRVLGHRRAAARAPVRRRGGEVHRRRDRRDVQQPRRPARPRAPGGTRGARPPAGGSALADQHPDWPRLRVGVNSGEAVVREIGGDGHVAYPLVGDTVNTGARLESLAPAGGVLIGAETRAELPDGAVVERGGLRMKGKEEPVNAYVLLALP